MALRKTVLPLIVSLALTVALTLACGPSIRRTFQSDNAFERCFDMDYRPGTTPDDKTACWSTWLEEHVYNQPGDKTQYARLRLDELAKGISVPGPPGPPGSFYERPTLDPDAGVSAAPTESSAKVLATTEDAGAPDPCADNCYEVAETCRTACRADTGMDEVCKVACDKSLAKCLSFCDDK